MYTPGYRPIIDAVVSLRKQTGLTQRDLAAALDWPQSLVGRLETGQRRLDLVELVAICRACGANPETEVTALTRDVARTLPFSRSTRRVTK